VIDELLEQKDEALIRKDEASTEEKQVRKGLKTAQNRCNVAQAIIERVREEGRAAQIRQRDTSVKIAKLQNELASLSEAALKLEKQLSD
jgi:hypothetical protein